MTHFFPTYFNHDEVALVTQQKLCSNSNTLALFISNIHNMVIYDQLAFISIATLFKLKFISWLRHLLLLFNEKYSLMFL